MYVHVKIFSVSLCFIWQVAKCYNISSAKSTKLYENMKYLLAWN